MSITEQLAAIAEVTDDVIIRSLLETRKINPELYPDDQEFLIIVIQCLALNAQITRSSLVDYVKNLRPEAYYINQQNEQNWT